jgi:hypothetical protein
MLYDLRALSLGTEESTRIVGKVYKLRNPTEMKVWLKLESQSEPFNAGVAK